MGVYAGVSTALAGGVILKAMAQRPNFYSATVYLAQSSANLMILTNLIFVTACAALLAIQKLLYGPLRPIEIEQLYEKAWFAVTETCLAMTIFRGEIGAWFLVMFFALLTGKVWGWIGEGRVEILEQQPPANPRLFHTRLAVSLILSVLFDTWMLEYIVKQVLHMARPDMMVMFGFEFAVLTIMSLSTLARYTISLVEILIIRGQKFRRAEEIRRERRDTAEAERRAAGEQTVATGDSQTATTSTAAPAIPDEPIDESEIEVEGWEEKGRWVFYLDLTTDFFKLVIYLSFFFILLVFYGLPIHIMRDVFLTCRSFFKRIADFIRYRTATRDMNERYPDASVEDIGREDVCIICREEMRPMPQPNADAGATAAGQPQQRPTNPVAERMRPKKLPCGHVLHFSCLRSWLERQQICPTCRRPVVPNVQIRIGGQGGQGPLAQGIAEGMAAARGQLGLGQGPAQPANGNGNGNANANANGQVQGDGQNHNRARIFQLGPLRIGVGAGRGELFEDLAQRLHNGDAGPGAGQNANNNNNNNVGANTNAAQQYGFGFGFGRPSRRSGHRHHNHTTVQARIDQTEAQIMQEIESLRIATNELHVVRMLQAELSRLRASRQGGAGTASTAPAVGAGSSTGMPSLTQTAVTSTQPMAAVPGAALVPDTRQNILEAGSQGLPEGLTLPPGWTMMPLQRLPGISVAMPTQPHQQQHAPPHLHPHPHPSLAAAAAAAGQGPQIRPFTPPLGLHPHPTPTSTQTAGTGIRASFTMQPQHPFHDPVAFPQENRASPSPLLDAMAQHRREVERLHFAARSPAGQQGSEGNNDDDDDVASMFQTTPATTDRSEDGINTTNSDAPQQRPSHNNVLTRDGPFRLQPISTSTATSPSQPPPAAPVPTSTIPLLPAWGSEAPSSEEQWNGHASGSASRNVNVEGDDQVDETEESTYAEGSIEDEDSAGKKKPRSATVEDLVEDPD